MGVAMTDATLAQGNGVLNLILQKKTPKEQLQELLESGILSDVLDADCFAIDRKKLTEVLGLKPMIRVYWDYDGRYGNSRNGCYRSFLPDEPGIRGAGETSDDAISSVLRTLGSFNRPYTQKDYRLVVKKRGQ